MTQALALPWANNGLVVDSQESMDSIIKKAGLDWTVSKRPMFYRSIPEAYISDATLPPCNERVDEHFALVRDSDNALLDVVGHRYKPTQNREAFDFFDKFVKECKMSIDTVGQLDNGRFVWALAKTGQELNIAANDSVGSYILLLSPHKLGRALLALHTSVRFACMNQLPLLLGSGKPVYRLSHTKLFNADAKQEAAQVLGLVNQGFKDFIEHGKVLASKKAHLLDVKEFFGAAFRMTDDQIANENIRVNRLMGKLVAAYQGGSPGSTLSGAKDTWWGALNAVTYVLDHQSGTDQGRNLKDNWLGARADIKRRALVLAQEMAA